MFEKKWNKWWRDEKQKTRTKFFESFLDEVLETDLLKFRLWNCGCPTLELLILRDEDLMRLDLPMGSTIRLHTLIRWNASLVASSG